MVVLSESYLQHLERKAIAEALAIHIQLKTFKRYVDKSHARFSSKHQVNTFQEIQTNKNQLSNTPYNMKTEINLWISWIFILLTPLTTNKNTYIDPHAMEKVFKGFLHRAHSICLEK